MKPVFAGKKRDQNEAAIIAALRAVGATVEQLSGPDVPDLLVGYGGVNYLIEVKMPKGELSDGQLEWTRSWRGATVWLVRTFEDAMTVIGCKATQK